MKIGTASYSMSILKFVLTFFFSFYINQFFLFLIFQIYITIPSLNLNLFEVSKRVKRFLNFIESTWMLCGNKKQVTRTRVKEACENKLNLVNFIWKSIKENKSTQCVYPFSIPARELMTVIYFMNFTIRDIVCEATINDYEKASLIKNCISEGISLKWVECLFMTRQIVAAIKATS